MGTVPWLTRHTSSLSKRHTLHHDDAALPENDDSGITNPSSFCVPHSPLLQINHGDVLHVDEEATASFMGTSEFNGNSVSMQDFGDEKNGGAVYNKLRRAHRKADTLYTVRSTVHYFGRDSHPFRLLKRIRDITALGCAT